MMPMWLTLWLGTKDPLCLGCKQQLTLFIQLLTFSASSGAREQVPVPRESLPERRELSQHSLSNSQGLRPPLSPTGKCPSGEKSHTFHTPTKSPHSSSISSLANKAAKSGGRLVFTTPYQRCDARLSEPFLRSDVLCLPTEDYETTFNPRASSLTWPSRPSEGRAEPCLEHSLIASAEAERRQQQDFLLLIP